MTPPNPDEMRETGIPPFTPPATLRGEDRPTNIPQGEGVHRVIALAGRAILNLEEDRDHWRQMCEDAWTKEREWSARAKRVEDRALVALRMCKEARAKLAEVEPDVKHSIFDSLSSEIAAIQEALR